MIAIKRMCKFFDVCKYAAKTSRTCTQDAGGDYCGAFRELSKSKKKEKILVSHWDEWFAPIYACPFCGEAKLLDDFNFCPECGLSLNDFVFEKEEEVCMRITKKKKKKNDKIKKGK